MQIKSTYKVKTPLGGGGDYFAYASTRHSILK